MPLFLQKRKKKMDIWDCMIPNGLPLWLSGKESACNVGDADQFLGGEDALEKGMATHSSILA